MYDNFRPQYLIEPDSDLTGESATNTVYTVKVSASDDQGGVVIGNGTHNYGEFAQVEANAFDSYEFAGWYNGDECVSTDLSYRFCVTDNVTLVAHFNPQKEITKPVTEVPTEHKYSITDGDNQTVEYGKEQELMITCDGNQADLLKLTMDDEVLDQDAYVVDGDNKTAVTLKADYVKSLAVGEHTLTFVYNDGSAAAKINVVYKEKQDGTVFTGDHLPVIWITLLCISGIVVLFLCGKYLFMKFHKSEKKDA